MSHDSTHRRLLRALLRLFPAEFRGDFGEQMAADFEDQRREVTAQPRAVRSLWLRTALDLLARAPREHFDVFWRDAIYAVRSLRRHRGSTATAVASLAIGIGLNAAVFSVVGGVLWRELPFPESDRLVQVAMVSPGTSPASLPETVYRQLGERVPALEAHAAATFRFATIVGPGDPERLTCPAVTPQFFNVLGAPVFGRPFTRGEYDQTLSDRASQAGSSESPLPRVMILSHATWRRRFGGDMGAIGSRVRLAGGDQVEVVGVAGPELASLAGTLLGAAGCWTPGALGPPGSAPVRSTAGSLLTVGRLAPNASRREVQAALNLIDVGPSPSNPVFGSDEPRSLSVIPLRDVVVGGVRTQLMLLFGAVICVLLVTCANVANLLLARASGRRDEMATRVALGATRARLARQWLTETFLVSIAGGTAGLLLALWAVPVLVAWAPSNVPRLQSIGVDWSTFVFVAIVSTAVGTCCGLLAGLPARRWTTLVSLSAIGRVTPRIGGVRQGLAVAEIALALILVVGATLMVRTVRALGAVDLGFDSRQVISARLPSLPGAFDLTKTQLLHADAIARVKALPGVRAAGVGMGPLTGGGMFWGGLRIPGDPRELDAIRVDAVSPGYFEALGARLLAGRFFQPRDMAGAGASPILLNETAARTFFGRGGAVGRTLMNGETDPQLVVGVVADLRHASLEVEPGPTIYQLATRSRNFLAGGMLVKVDGDPEALVPAIRSIVRSLNPEAPFDGVTPLQERIDREAAPRRFVLQVIGLFSLVGLALAVVGVYGVLAEFVTQRVPEIGVRMAFGATAGDVVRLILRQGWRLSAVGVPLGLAGAAALSGTMRAQVYGVETLDPITFATAAMCLLAATAAACAFPARRAARLDPVVALRLD
jgi:predicted permease